jgi:hypothetical protein
MVRGLTGSSPVAPGFERISSDDCDNEPVPIAVDQSPRPLGAQMVVESTAAGSVVCENCNLHLASALRILCQSHENSAFFGMQFK